MSIYLYLDVIREAWENYDPSRKIVHLDDISARVSTNHVYRLRLDDGEKIIAKLSYFGLYEHFVEDHTIINSLANNLPAPFENFLARSLMKGNQLYVYRYQQNSLDVWVVFYRPVPIKKHLPRRLNEEQIHKLGEQMALFHKSCHQIRHTLPPSSKTLFWDIEDLLKNLDNPNHPVFLSPAGADSSVGQHLTLKKMQDATQLHCRLFQENAYRLGLEGFDCIPVFVDWNIGNFSVTSSFRLFSRWDYDWFRMSTRMMDFYFFSRVVSDVGDRTDFIYNISPLSEDRFMLFLKAYHRIFPLTPEEVRFLPEAYRFFILHYVVNYGRYFFSEHYTRKLQAEAFTVCLPSIEGGFDEPKILRALALI